MQPVTLEVPQGDAVAERRAHLQKLMRSHGRGRVVFSVLALLSPIAVRFGYGVAAGLFVFFALNAMASALKYRVLRRRLADLEAFARDFERARGADTAASPRAR